VVLRVVSRPHGRDSRRIEDSTAELTCSAEVATETLSLVSAQLPGFVSPPGIAPRDWAVLLW